MPTITELAQKILARIKTLSQKDIESTSDTSTCNDDGNVKAKE